MCMQCVSAGASYVVPAVAGLQVYRLSLRRKRLAKAKVEVPTAKS
jgi:hypothetical protein